MTQKLYNEFVEYGLGWRVWRGSNSCRERNGDVTRHIAHSYVRWRHDIGYDSVVSHYLMAPLTNTIIQGTSIVAPALSISANTASSDCIAPSTYRRVLGRAKRSGNIATMSMHFVLGWAWLRCYSERVRVVSSFSGSRSFFVEPSQSFEMRLNKDLLECRFLLYCVPTPITALSMLMVMLIGAAV